MPEAAIHKHREPEFGKDKVRFSKHWLIASPTCDTMLPEQFCQRQFRILVSP